MGGGESCEVHAVLLDAAAAVCTNPSEEDDWEVVRASDLARLRAALAQ